MLQASPGLGEFNRIDQPRIDQEGVGALAFGRIDFDDRRDAEVIDINPGRIDQYGIGAYRRHRALEVQAPSDRGRLVCDSGFRRSAGWLRGMAL